MSDTGSLMWFIGTTAGLIAILAGCILAASRRNAYQRPHRRSKWPTGPWP